eukprot:TRINITY_DN22055_c0_g1_i1.p1 TRINITY_DN22055_c0_g1~~TRINITY_DN22055_c0_g1_i1.p1  ORF type:complete len:489 (+),score=61.67 TRINITY_DN22055_c0_g1_i1:106-1572(+)
MMLPLPSSSPPLQSEPSYAGCSLPNSASSVVWDRPSISSSAAPSPRQASPSEPPSARQSAAESNTADRPATRPVSAVPSAFLPFLIHGDGPTPRDDPRAGPPHLRPVAVPLHPAAAFADEGAAPHVAQAKVVLAGPSGAGKSSLLERYVFDHYAGGGVPTIGVDFHLATLEIPTETRSATPRGQGIAGPTSPPAVGVGNPRMPASLGTGDSVGPHVAMTEVLQSSRVKIQVWDTAGQERFKSICRTYWRGADAVLLCFDLSSRDSWAAMPQWVADVAPHLTPQDFDFLGGGDMPGVGDSSHLLSKNVRSQAGRAGVRRRGDAEGPVGPTVWLVGCKSDLVYPRGTAPRAVTPAEVSRFVAAYNLAGYVETSAAVESLAGATAAAAAAGAIVPPRRAPLSAREAAYSGGAQDAALYGDGGGGVDGRLPRHLPAVHAPPLALLFDAVAAEVLMRHTGGRRLAPGRPLPVPPAERAAPRGCLSQVLRALGL